MTVDYRHGIAILEVVANFPSLVMALLLAWRHGFGRSSGWLFFIIFSLLRIIGNCCYLATINNSSNENLYIAWAVCSSIGLSPLTLGLLYNLSRVNDSIQRKTGNGFWPHIFRIVALVTLIGVILSITGVTTTDNLTAGLSNTQTKVGLILYLVSWVALVVLLLLVWTRYNSIETGEHRLLGAVTICTPILLVRLIYSFLVTFKHDKDFSLVTGNVTIQLVMVVIEEILIVYIMLLTGLTLDPKEKAVYVPTSTAENGETAYDPRGRNNNTEMSYQGNADGNYATSTLPLSGRKPKRQLRGGPIRMLIAYTLNKIDERRQ
ncbi:hypothetical protein BGW36DRAFT_294009 [Talaromyces proteolyticus]|uniref:DUF7702 domain-containing protein n=1 Tax=Talaromyces proteolyticus TaxID=1131652 RepID=A0AAD4PX81_9EURO|nr:uncharacterized protein BGW36DRAFT_294009 [Talaromyces proteolyticus]KAH8699042.1 hypothetical protein BGW36DRAFT_294009 [Talaromyces proteolyticus]